MLKWLRERISLDKQQLCSCSREVVRDGCSWDYLICANAAEMGHVEEVQGRMECPWSKLTCQSAAITGHLEIL